MTAAVRDLQIWMDDPDYRGCQIYDQTYDQVFPRFPWQWAFAVQERRRLVWRLEGLLSGPVKQGVEVTLG